MHHARRRSPIIIGCDGLMACRNITPLARRGNELWRNGAMANLGSAHRHACHGAHNESRGVALVTLCTRRPRLRLSHLPAENRKSLHFVAKSRSKRPMAGGTATPRSNRPHHLRYHQNDDDEKNRDLLRACHRRARPSTLTSLVAIRPP